MADTAASASVSVGCNIQYLTTPPGVLKLLQIILGLISWACVVSPFQGYFTQSAPPALQFAMFLAIAPWVCTIIFLIIFMTGINATTCSGVPWGVVETLFNGIVTLLYFVAACIISVYGRDPSIAAGAAFAFLTTIAYLVHFAFSFKEWRGLWPWQGCGTAAPTTTNT